MIGVNSKTIAILASEITNNMEILKRLVMEDKISKKEFEMKINVLLNKMNKLEESLTLI